MYRAILFDFYGVWGPDNFQLYIDRAEQMAPETAHSIRETVQNYFLGLSDIQEVVDGIRYKFRMSGIELTAEDLLMNTSNVSPEIIQFIQYLHGHFIKVGVLANLGRQEYAILADLQQQYDLFDTVTGPDKLGLPLLSPEVFAKALQDLGEPPEDCMVISGSDAYIQFAQSLGLQTLRFEGFPKLVEAIKQQLETPTR
jgi:FMN phosphatase YigB (HAD superfamily)